MRGRLPLDASPRCPPKRLAPPLSRLVPVVSALARLLLVEESLPSASHHRKRRLLTLRVTDVPVVY